MKNRTIIHSMKAAMRGLTYAYTHERNFRFEVYAALGALLLLFPLKALASDWIAVIFCIMFVFLAEVVNTALERAVDIIKPHKHPYARVIKDLSAAFVFMSVILSFIVGCFIYLPLFAQLIFQ